VVKFRFTAKWVSGVPAAAPCQVLGVKLDRPRRPLLDREAEPRREAHGPEHAQVVFAEPLVGVADGADHAGPQVLAAADVVDDRVPRKFRQRVLEEAVDGEVAPPRVVLGVGELDLAGPPAVFVAPLEAEGGDLDLVAHQPHQRHAERLADELAAAEEPRHDFRGRVGGDVVIGGLASEQPVADAPAGEVRDVARVAQHAHDLRRRVTRAAWRARLRGA
jgi:hypothetical protein